MRYFPENKQLSDFLWYTVLSEYHSGFIIPTMPSKIHYHNLIVILQVCLFVILLILPPTTGGKAESAPFSAYDLIGAVNALRAAYGLPAFNIDGSLMASAQAHTEYQAVNQTMTHYGPGGNTANERAAAAGYLGRVSENIAVFTLGFDNVLSWVVYEAWADDIHMNTMINSQYTDVGAGVVVGGDRVYITLDAGWPEGRYPLPTRMTWTPGGLSTPGTPMPAFEPLVVSTPQPDGSLIHVVGYGQSLIGIAGAYSVSVTDLATLNNINPDQIYAGQKLIIHPAITPTVSLIPTQDFTTTPLVQFSPTPTTTLIPISIVHSPMRLTGIVIIAVCLIAFAIILWVGRK